MSDAALLLCPFCGDEPEFVENHAVLFTDYYVKCTGCSACSGSIRKTDFSTFTVYKVADFRRNKNLRPKEEASHEIHLTKQREDAIAKWNVRPTPEPEEMNNE